MCVVAEVIDKPVVDIIKIKLSHLFEESRMTNSVKCFAEIQRHHNDVRVGDKHGGYGLYENDDCSGCRPSWAKRELVA